MKYLKPTDLAERWSITTKTLANNRTRGLGPEYVKVGSLVRYPLEAIERYEAQRTVQAVFT